MPLSREQDLLPAAVSPVPRHRAGPCSPLAGRQARASYRFRTAAAAGHHGYVLHPRLQRQPELAAHTIAVIRELLLRGTVQYPDIKKVQDINKVQSYKVFPPSLN